MMDMTLPSLLFGVLLSSLLGGIFHLWKNGGLGQLILYFILSWVGFWLGHIIAIQLDIVFFSVGPLHLGPAIVGSFLFLGVGHWLSLVRID